MKIQGNHVIDADRDTVWKALNDTTILKRCIPGCQHIAWKGNDAMEAVVGSAVGPLKLTITGQVKISDVVPGESYRLSGSGNAGTAGHVSGHADVRLEALDAASTRLDYDVDVSVGGKLAQVGSKLVEGTARRQADQFFKDFTEIVSGREPLARPRTGLLIAGAIAAAVVGAVIIYLLL